MLYSKLPGTNGAGSKLTATSTATELKALIRTAGSDESFEFSKNENTVFVHVIDGQTDIRIFADGNTPTTALGLLLEAGDTKIFHGVDPTMFQIISTGANSTVEVAVGLTPIGVPSDTTGFGAVTLEASGITIGDVDSNIVKVGGVLVSAKNAAFAEVPLGVGAEFEAIGALTVDGGTAGDKVPYKASAEGVPYSHITTVDGGVSAVIADDAAQAALPGMVNVGGEYRDADDAYTDGDAVINHYNSKGELKVTGGASSVNAEYLSPSDFTAVYTSNVTITLSGLPFSIIDDSQIAFIKFIPTGGSGSSIIVNGSGGATITEASGVLTVNGAGTPFAASDVYEVGINGPKKGYDLALDSLKTIEQAPVWTRYTDKETWLAAAYELTASFADVGAEIDVRGYNKLRLWVTVDIGTSTNPQIRVLEKHTSAGSEEYREIYLGSPAANITSINLNDYEVASDADQLISFVIDLDGTVPFVQLQAKDDANGDGQIDALYITKAYSA